MNMNKPMMLRRILLAPPTLRSSLLPLSPRIIPLPRYSTTLPSVAQTSFWVSLVPKPLRRGSRDSSVKKKVKSKEWNPATFFICIFLLIGSMSIQMIALKNEFGAHNRRADARLALLREIIGRIQNGEDVDVEGLLGTGDKEREKEWEEVLKEIEEEDQAWENSRRSKPKHGRNLELQNEAAKLPATTTETDSAQRKEKPKSNAPTGFY